MGFEKDCKKSNGEFYKDEKLGINMCKVDDEIAVTENGEAIDLSD